MRRLLTIVAVLVACGAIAGLATQAAAAATVDWAAPQAIDRSIGLGLTDVACPAAHQCTAVDNAGREITFDPAAPDAASSAVISQGVGLSAVACPTTTQCTATQSGRLTPGGFTRITFAPRAPAQARATTLTTRGFPTDLACPTATQCTATVTGLGCQAEELTFDPTSTAPPSATTIDSSAGCTGVRLGPVLSLACSSAAQCVAVDDAGQEVTFDPRSPGTPAPTAVDPGQSLTAVACPASSRCVAGDSAGSTIAFDPTVPAGATTTLLGAARVADVACVSPSSCAVVDTSGGATSFDPDTAKGVKAAIDPGRVPVALACASTAQCTAVDSSGLETTFDPAGAGAPSNAPLAAANQLNAVSCSTPSRCTALDAAGGAVTFDPGSADTGNRAQLPQGTGGTSPHAIACPAAGLCVAIRARDTPNVLTFDPRAASAAAGTTIPDVNALVGLACPTASECVVTDSGGEAITFDPRSPGNFTPVAVDPTDRSLGPVACPSAIQCTAIAYGAGAVTFTPGTASGAQRLPGVDPAGAVLAALTCPSVAQCTALDTAGDEVTFAPRSSAAGRTVAIGAARSLASLACPRVNFCVAVDIAGRAITGDPTAGATWTTTAIPGAGPLNAVTCPTMIECVAVDALGQELTGAAPPPTPPTLSRIGQAHTRWRDRHRRRRGAPRLPVGTTFTARISEPAKLTVTITTRVAGRRGPAGLCLRTKARHPRPRCLRTTTVGVLSATVRRAGSAKLRFSGRVSGGRLLPPGRYTASIFATDAFGSSSRPRSLTFTIVR